MAFQPLSLTEPGVRSPTFIAGGAGAGCGCWQASRVSKVRSTAGFISRAFYFVINEVAEKEPPMDDTDRNGNGAEDDEQFEQMIVENSILLHSLAALLVRKAVLKQEEIDD